MRVAELRAGAGGTPDHEVWRMLQAATGRSRADLVLNPEVDEVASRAFADMVRRRRAGEPLQYIEGTVQFGPLELAIDKRSLIPRPETEQLWELVLTAVSAAPRVIVDLCTGSGNLAFALKYSFPEARVLATELSPDAADLARENSARTGLAVEILEGDLFQPLPTDLRGCVDVLVANPPYLAEAELAALPTDVREHEPHEALVAGVHGDEILKSIVGQADRWLAPGGLLAIEISEFLGPRALELMERFTGRVVRDLTGRDRFVLGNLPHDLPSDHVAGLG